MKKYTVNLKQLLNEARLTNLRTKTTKETPKLASRSDFVTTDYIGISKFGIFNFRTTSQTNPGNYWYQTLEIPDLESKVMEEDITPALIKELVEQSDIKIYCDCLTGDSKILLADGTYKNIKDIQVGDVVVTHKGNKKIVKGKSSRQSYGDLLELDLGSKKIKCTENHQFLIKENDEIKWIKAKDLKPDMELLELGDV